MKIAFTVYRGNPNSGGQGVYTHYLTRELVKLGHEVTVFSGPPYPEVAPGVKIERLPGLDLFGDPDPFSIPPPWKFPDLVSCYEVGLMLTGAFPDPKAFGLRLRRYFGRLLEQFDVIHDNQSLNWTLARLVDAGASCVASIHHPITVDRRLALESSAGIKRKFGLRRFFSFVPMQASVARRLPRIITVSRQSAIDLATELGIELDLIDIASVGVDTEIFRPLPGVEREPGLICTTVSAAAASKGLTYLLEAISLLPSTRLVVIGPQSRSKPVLRAVEDLRLGDRVYLAGRVTTAEMVELYSRAQLVVIPSVYEGFSLPVVEAMACAVPLVASAGGAIPEVVGDLAPLAATRSATALAEAISAVFANYSAAIDSARHARKRVKARFSWQQTAERTIDSYARAMGRADDHL